MYLHVMFISFTWNNMKYSLLKSQVLKKEIFICTKYKYIKISIEYFCVGIRYVNRLFVIFTRVLH